MRRFARLLFPLFTALLTVAPPVLAEGVSVKGDAGDLTVEADGAELKDVIVAVGEAVGSTIAPPASLPAATITGVYQGSISEVLKALAPAAAFVVAWRDGRVSVHFVDGGEWTPISEAKPAAAADGVDGEPAEEPGKMQPGGAEPPSPARRIY